MHGMDKLKKLTWTTGIQYLEEAAFGSPAEYAEKKAADPIQPPNSPKQ